MKKINGHSIVEKGIYELDVFDDGTTALTDKNSKFIEGVIKLDSNYAADGDINAEDSIANLFYRLKNNLITFDEFAIKIVTTIDRTNSTNLESAKGG